MFCAPMRSADPQRDERLACAASHERGGAVVLAQRGENVVESFVLVRERSLWRALDFRAFEPCANRREVLRFELIEIVAGDRIESGALLNHIGKAVAVRERAPAVQRDPRGR